MRGRYLTGVVFVAFLAGAYVGKTENERRIANACLLGQRMQIDSIVIRCPAMAPTWRDR